MNIRELLILLHRRWRGVAAFMTATVAASAIVALSVPLSYVANARVILEPPITKGEKGVPANPLLGVSGSQFVVADVVAQIVNDDAVRGDLVARGASDYSVSGVGGVAPLLAIEAVAGDPDQALRTTAMVATAIKDELAAQQRLSGGDEAAFITSRTLLRDTEATSLADGRTRAAVATFGLWSVVGLTAITLADSALPRRRARRRSADHGDELSRRDDADARLAFLESVPPLRGLPPGPSAPSVRLAPDTDPNHRWNEQARSLQAGSDGG